MNNSPALEDAITDKMPEAEHYIMKALDTSAPLDSPKDILNAFPKLNQSTDWFDAYKRVINSKVKEYPELAYVREILRLAYDSRYPDVSFILFSRFSSLPGAPKTLKDAVNSYVDLLRIGATKTTRAMYLSEALSSSSNYLLRELYENASKYQGKAGVDAYADWVDEQVRNPETSRRAKRDFSEAADAIQILDFLYEGEYYEAVRYLLDTPDSSLRINDAVSIVMDDYARPFNLI